MKSTSGISGRRLPSRQPGGRQEQKRSMQVPEVHWQPLLHRAPEERSSWQVPLTPHQASLSQIGSHAVEPTQFVKQAASPLQV
jgi:hypothetical protein